MSSKKALTPFTLAMIMVATILSIRNWPLTAEFGFASIFFVLVASLLFFIPSAMVSAELASAWPENGGVFIWVKKALGARLGFLAVWLLWIENVVWYPTILSFVAAALGYALHPPWMSSPTFSFCVIVVVFWSLTLANMMGMKLSGWISSIGVLLGTLLPGAIIIALGFWWYFSGFEIAITIDWRHFFPRFNHLSEFSFLAGVLLGFGGMEMPALHVRDIPDPQRNYPRAVFTSSLLIIGMTIFGTLAITFVIPKEEINLVSGSIEAIGRFLSSYHLEALIPWIAILVMIGSLGGVSTWIAGPCRGLLAAASDGELPKVLHQVNKHNMPSRLLLIQALIVTALSSIFLFLPTVSASYWILVVVAAELYLIMYILMFLAGVILRFKEPKQKRLYAIPGGKGGMLFVSGIGVISSLFAMIMGFVPPEELSLSGWVFFEAFLVIAILLACGIPFLILELQKPPRRKG